MAGIPIHRWAATKNTSSISNEVMDSLSGIPFIVVVCDESGEFEIASNVTLPFLAHFRDVLDDHVKSELRKN